VIKAAGGIVFRGGDVLLVHRPRYDDWSFPKGKLDGGESWEDAALREVEEETGLHCTLGDEVGRTHYEVGGEPKEVRYYAMESDEDPFAQNEVDEVRFVPVAEALELLTQAWDRDLLREIGTRYR
jgi:8-oxo-dGTP diphosphatase